MVKKELLPLSNSTASLNPP